MRDCLLMKDSLHSSRLPFELVHARTKDEFESAINQARFDLILSDYTIPAYSGMAALALAKKVQPDVPFLFVSGTIGEERAVESLKSGAADYVLKDHLDRLGSVIRRALREAEERRRRKAAEESLKESEARFRQVAENLGQVLWLADTRKDEILYVSPAYEKIWGRSLQSLYENPRSWMDAIHPDDRDRVVETARSKQPYWPCDETYRVLRPDGSIRWIRDHSFPIRNEAGDVYRIVRIAEDATEHQLLEGQLRQAQKMEAVGQLAGGVAHDFNNLLCVIRGNADLVLTDRQQLSEQNRECLNQIAAASERAANLTKQLLAFGRKQALQPRPLNLNTVIANLAKMLDRVIGENIRVRCDYDSSQPHVMADPGMIEQVLLNLVLNARDAMPAGGDLLIGTRKMSFDETKAMQNSEASAGDFVCLTVTDSGTGIAAEHLPHIFEPFFTTKGLGKGTGLGLATVYGIVKQHHGWIEVDSQPGAGSAFKVFLPMIQAPVSETSLTQDDLILRGGTEKILMVEDDASVRSMTRRTLEAFGYQVWEAASAQEAFQLLNTRASDADLLLTDIAIPGGITGCELAKEMRSLRPSLKVIFMSGYNVEMSKPDTDFIRKASACFLQKPHSSSLLINTVRRCLDAGKG